MLDNGIDFFFFLLIPLNFVCIEIKTIWNSLFDVFSEWSRKCFHGS